MLIKISVTSYGATGSNYLASSQLSRSPLAGKRSVSQRPPCPWEHGGCTHHDGPGEAKLHIGGDRYVCLALVLHVLGRTGSRGSSSRGRGGCSTVGSHAGAVGAADLWEMAPSAWRLLGMCRLSILWLIVPPSVPSSVPSQPPENVRAISITSDVAVISWSEPPRSTLNGVLKGYRVIFWSLYMDGGESRWRAGDVGDPAGWRRGADGARLPAEWGEMQNITTTRERVELRGMEKFTNYSVQVLAYTQAGDGVRSSVLYIQTKEDSKWCCPG